jgi:serine/threonine protein kinase
MTPCIKAPELFPRCIPTHKSDIWCVGLILFEMLTDYHPFLNPESFKKTQ